MDLPRWFDPERDVMLTPATLRGLVHPIRVRIMRLLQTDGPATATALAAKVGESSGVTSYHLRVLAAHGFIVEDTERGTGRDRWWRAVHRSISFTYRTGQEPADENAEAFMRMRADEMHRDLVEYIEGMSARGAEQTTELFRTARWPLRLTPEQANQVIDAIEELLGRYARWPDGSARETDAPPPEPRAQRVLFQFQLIPEHE